MSYCRFTKDSDVYAYECDGGVQFWVAVKANNGLNRLCNTYNEAYQYAKSLRDEHGLDVPDYAIEALRSDALKEVKRFSGPNGAVAELQAENAELRSDLLLAQRIIGQISHEGFELIDDNKKLRELATETMRLMQTNGPDCGLCKHYDECWAGDAMNYSPSGCVICNEARELGIEVE